MYSKVRSRSGAKRTNWAIVSNGQPNIGKEIHWEMGTENGWIGYTYGVDYGYMEFFEDGTVNIHRLTDDGVATDETGKYTIDEANKVIDIDINVLCANTWVAGKSGKLNILSLTSDGLQIALPNTDEYAYSVNYYSQRKAEADAKIPVSLICVVPVGVVLGELRSHVCLRMRWQVSTHSLTKAHLTMLWCLPSIFRTC